MAVHVICVGEDGGVYRVTPIQGEFDAGDEWRTESAAGRENSCCVSVDCNRGGGGVAGVGELVAVGGAGRDFGIWGFCRRGHGLRLWGVDIGMGVRTVRWMPGGTGRFCVGDERGGVGVYNVGRGECSMCLGWFGKDGSTCSGALD